MTSSIAAALRRARSDLEPASDTPDLDARWLLKHVLQVGDGWLIAHGDDTLDAEARGDFETLVARRAAGEPLAYVIGRAGFWHLELSITPAVLVPRPDTETLVATVLDGAGTTPDLRVADLGTGSGAIALALEAERPEWRIVATDASDDARACARANARRLGLSNLCFARGHWFHALGDARFDVIVSNPPYVAAGDPHLVALGFEPRAALVAGDDGLDDIRILIAGASAHLNDDGWLVLEHGADQGAAVRALLDHHGFQAIGTENDLGGRERVTHGRLA